MKGTCIRIVGPAVSLADVFIIVNQLPDPPPYPRTVASSAVSLRIRCGQCWRMPLSSLLPWA